MIATFPPCVSCKAGVLLPLSDYATNGAAIMFKAWVCSNPECGRGLRIDAGKIVQLAAPQPVPA